MADNLSTANANLAVAAAVGTNAGFVQLHKGAPGSAGTANVSSVTTRPAVTWGSASAGTIAATGTLPSWTSWAGVSPETVTDISFWSANSAGTFGLSMQLSASVTMNTGDNLSLTAVSVAIPTAS
jgi:hypothetical protein